MYILGIGGLGYKDSSAAILDDGRIVAAVAEERFSGNKHQGGFPDWAIRFCLWKAGISLKDVGVVAVAVAPPFLIRSVRRMNLPDTLRVME